MKHHRTLATEAALASLPARVRAAIAADRSPPEAGAIMALAAFWAAWGAESKTRTAPSLSVFRNVATSESRLGTLLRALVCYAPDVQTHHARALRQEFYALRGENTRRSDTGKVSGDASGQIRPSKTSLKVVSDWPENWHALWDRLAASPRRKPSTIERHRRSINCCAAMVRQLNCTSDFGFALADQLATAFAEKGIRTISIANYLEALVVLGDAGGIDEVHLDAMRFVVDRLRETARSEEKWKEPRLRDWDEAGGFALLAEQVSTLAEKIAALPTHTAEAHRLRATTALIALFLNKPARKGDARSWRLGVELTRTDGGDWRLAWTQEKTDHDTEAGYLWPETALALDALILGGRSPHQAHARYIALEGCNWLTLRQGAPGRDYPSALVKEATGLPAHDFRTIAADLLRRHDPSVAADILSAHLGHRSAQSTEAYRALAEGDAATEIWRRFRNQIRKSAGLRKAIIA